MFSYISAVGEFQLNNRLEYQLHSVGGLVIPSDLVFQMLIRKFDKDTPVFVLKVKDTQEQRLDVTPVEQPSIVATNQPEETSVVTEELPILQQQEEPTNVNI